jgi:signal transduction histidine kinase
MLGVMGVYHADKDVFTVEHLDLLVAIARQVSVAVSNAQRYAQIDRRLTEMTVVRQVVQVVNRRLEMQALLDEAVHQVGAVLGYPVVEVYLVEEHFLVLGAAHGGPFDPDTRYHMSEGILGRVVRTNRAAFVPVVAEDPDYIVGFQETACEIAVPLRVEGVAIGVLNVESPRPGDLAEEDTRLLMLLADQLAVAIENAALYERVRSHAESLESVVARRTSELAEALIRAQSADRLKTQFVSDVSHELRTPLSNIRLYLDLLRKGQKDRFDDYMRTLNRETNRLVNLIEDLLAISRLDAGTVTPHPSSFNLNVLGRGLVEDRRRLFGDRDLTLGLSLQSDLPNVVADEQMISQVIANLMTNALNYTPAGGSVTLRRNASRSLNASFEGRQVVRWERQEQAWGCQYVKKYYCVIRERSHWKVKSRRAAPSRSGYQFPHLKPKRQPNRFKINPDLIQSNVFSHQIQEGFHFFWLTQASFSQRSLYQLDGFHRILINEQDGNV